MCIRDRRYIEKSFECTSPTNNASCKTHSIFSPDKKIEVVQMIWDTAGQECYRSLASFYYKDSDAIILVYDITNRKSFESLNFWIEEIKSNADKDVLLTIAGNKSDAINEEKVETSEVMEFAKISNASFFLVSAKENSNVVEMYLELGMRRFPEFKAAFKSKRVGNTDKKQAKGKGAYKNNKRSIGVKLSAKEKKEKGKNCC
eukprot:TRINITY_DN2503_c0_g1_i5.p1 TRINITY_DN2503_c0_g1~~TRINITY_DN2503_c0_g1_i5.p1  ORF type:complete len:202 (+),score=53.56 TRINITY_DN2503_c0_g1_i5:96-701(+)